MKDNMIIDESAPDYKEYARIVYAGGNTFARINTAEIDQAGMIGILMADLLLAGITVLSGDRNKEAVLKQAMYHFYKELEIKGISLV